MVDKVRWMRVKIGVYYSSLDEFVSAITRKVALGIKRKE